MDFYYGVKGHHIESDRIISRDVLFLFICSLNLVALEITGHVRGFFFVLSVPHQDSSSPLSQEKLPSFFKAGILCHQSCLIQKFDQATYPLTRINFNHEV